MTLVMSAIGTKQTFPSRPSMSAFGGKADISHQRPLRPSEANLFGCKPYASQSTVKRIPGATPVLPHCNSNATPFTKNQKIFSKSDA